MNEDLLSCENEPIRFSGAVQPHGALLMLDAQDRLIEAASASCATLLGLEPQDLLGQPLEAVFDPAFCLRLQADATAQAMRPHPLTRQDQALHVQWHRNAAGKLIVETEPCVDRPGATDSLFLYRRGMAGLRQSPQLADLWQASVDLVKSLTQFDRVMLYRFDADANGEVVAEACSEGIESYLGLCFPASDIPGQARALFTWSKVRHIPDTAYRPSALLSCADAHAIDLGLSCLRSVSPLHIEYLTNMRVNATLVGSLVVNGSLWGLVSCHHQSGPRFVDAQVREVLGWLCDDIASAIGVGQIRERYEAVTSLAERRRKVVDRIRRVDIRSLVRQGPCGDLLDAVGADGFALLLEDGMESTGSVPTEQQVRELNRLRLERPHPPGCFASDALQQDLGLDAACGPVAGALFVSVPGIAGATLVWFRVEQVRTVRWGGNPAHAPAADDAGRISPRKSFAQYLQAIRGKSKPWLPDERESAIELGALIEIDALRKQNAFTQTVLNSLPAQIAVLDGKGFIRLVNASWQQFAIHNGMPEPARQFIGRNYLDFCRSDAPDAELASQALHGIRAVLQHRAAHFSLEYPCDAPDQARWFRMDVHRMLEPCEGALVAHEDVTRIKTAERALIAAKAEALKASQAKTGFLAAASHDLRQPLSALSLYIGVLQQRNNPDIQKIVSSMHDCCESLMELMTDLLDVTKLDTGVVRPSLTDLCLQDFIASLISVHAVEAAVKGLQLRSRPSKEFVYTDIQLLNRICGNLLSNSIRYTSRGGVLVAPRHRGGKFWLEFWDTGEGIPDEQSDQVFEEFVQLSNKSNRKGSGLGLAIVAKAATLLGLEIRMRSSPGRGSLFAIELTPGRSFVPSAAPDRAPEPRCLQVAVVEDNAQVLESMVAALQGAGHHVVAATSSAQLFARLGMQGPDVLISDYRLGATQNGYDVIRAARARYGEALPATIVTGDTDPELVRSMARRGITIHYKPLKLEALLAFVREAATRPAP